MVENKYYGYYGPGDNTGEFRIDKGQIMTGTTIGIVVLDCWYPIIPGNVACASTYNYPVRHKMIPGSKQPRVHAGDPTLVDDIVKAAQELESEGVRAICGACGYLGNFQDKVAAAVDAPVFLSSLLQVPMIKMSLKPGQKIGILCADAPSLKPEILAKNNITNLDDVIIRGVGDQPEFSAILQSDRGHFNTDGVRAEIVGAVTTMVQEHPEIGAILLECSDMPPYSADVQRAVNLPVFDFITMINWVHQAVAQKPYYGFI